MNKIVLFIYIPFQLGWASHYTNNCRKSGQALSYKIGPKGPTQQHRTFTANFTSCRQSSTSFCISLSLQWLMVSFLSVSYRLSQSPPEKMLRIASFSSRLLALYPSDSMNVLSCPLPSRTATGRRRHDSPRSPNLKRLTSRVVRLTRRKQLHQVLLLSVLYLLRFPLISTVRS